MKKNEIKILGLSSLGGMLEFYDFIIFVFFASYISKLFFPAHLDPFWQNMNTYGAFAAGFLARPLGGIVMAHFGDKYGRKNMFMLSILLMVIPTFALGLMPTFESIGYGAPIILLIIRIFQGIAIGGELPGAWVFISEHAKKQNLFLSIGILTSAVVGGILLGNLASIIMNTNFTKEELSNWAWRIPFIVGGLFGLISLYLRKFLSETPVFKEMQKKGELEKIPLKNIFKNYKFASLISMSATWVLTGCVLILLLLMPNFLPGFFEKNGIILNKIDVLYTQMFCIISVSVGCITYGFLADKFGLIKISLIFNTLFIIFLFLFANAIFNEKSIENTNIYYYLSCFFSAIGPCGSPFFMVKLFPSKIRFSGISFSYNIAYAISGGITPVFFVFASKKDPWLIFIYLFILAAIFFVVNLLFSSKNKQ